MKVRSFIEMFNEATPELIRENGMRSTVWIRKLKIKKAIDQENVLRLSTSTDRKRNLIESTPLIAVQSVKLIAFLY